MVAAETRRQEGDEMAQTGPLRADCAQARDGRSAADELELSAYTGASWPLRSHLELGALPSAVPCARLHAKQVLREWGLDALAEAVELLASELVTNGVQASEGMTESRCQGRWRPGVPSVRLWLCSDKQNVLVQVWDGSDRRPERKDVDLEAVGGRGLLLVEALSAEWGTYVPERSSGKVVWALVAG
jgi:anti-sigma regulatory factor (Ser/Thr protein kinase)